MPVWSTFVGAIGSLLNELAQSLDGSYGLAIIAVALMSRCLLLPLTLNMAEQSWFRQQRMKALKPQLELLSKKHAHDRAAHAVALQSLYREHGLAGGMGVGLLTALVQLPLGAGIYAAIRQGAAGAGSFLWINKLARPDIWLALIVAFISFAAMLLNPAMSEQTKLILQLLPVIISFFLVWHLAAALGLYMAGSGTVTGLQAFLLRRRLALLVKAQALKQPCS